MQVKNGFDRDRFFIFIYDGDLITTVLNVTKETRDKMEVGRINETKSQEICSPQIIRKEIILFPKCHQLSNIFLKFKMSFLHECNFPICRKNVQRIENYNVA